MASSSASTALAEFRLVLVKVTFSAYLAHNLNISISTLRLSVLTQRALPIDIPLQIQRIDQLSKALLNNTVISDSLGI